jgi:Jag N-terminus
MKTAEGRGRTLDEAVDAALIQLAESRRNVDVKVLSETPEETVVEVTVIAAWTPSGAAAA